MCAGWPTCRCAPAAATRSSARRPRRARSSTSSRTASTSHTLRRDDRPRRAGAQRHRARALRTPSRGLRSLRAQPRDRLVHPHRRGDERHGRRGHDHASLMRHAVSVPRGARRGAAGGSARPGRLRRRRRPPARERPCPTPRPPCAAAPRPGDHRITSAAPARRRSSVHVPEGLRAGRRVPLVLGLHGAGQDARGFEGESNFTAGGRRAPLRHRLPAVVAGAGLLAVPRARRPPQRPALPARDARRGGGHPVRRSRPRARYRDLVGRADDLRRRLRAGRPAAARIAPVSGGTRQLPTCHPARPISILDTHGTSDQIVSYRGRGADHDGRVRDVMDDWARREGCRPAPARTSHRPLCRASGVAAVPRPACGWRTCASRAAGTR